MCGIPISFRPVSHISLLQSPAPLAIKYLRRGGEADGCYTERNIRDKYGGWNNKRDILEKFKKMFF